MTARVSRRWAVDQLAAGVLSELATEARLDGDRLRVDVDISEVPEHVRHEVLGRAAVLATALVATPRSVATALAALAGDAPPTPTAEEET